MAEFPMFPLWTDAYLGDTAHLTMAEHGAYLLLLITMWRTAEKSLPNDDSKLARFVRANPQQWARVKPAVMDFFDVEGDRITQGRLRDEASATQDLAKRQSRKARARWLKTKGTDDAAALPKDRSGNASPSPTHPPVDLGDVTTKILPLLDPSAQNGSANGKAGCALKHAVKIARFDEFWNDAYPHRGGRKKARKSALEKYTVAVKRGVPEAAIIDGAKRAAKLDPDVARGFARDPTTWINQEGWTDDFTGKRPPEGDNYEVWGIRDAPPLRPL